MSYRPNRLRGWIRKKVPKQKRRDLIEAFVHHKGWYDQGLRILASFRLVQITDVAILMAVFRYIAGENVSIWWVVAFGAAYYIGRTYLHWWLGRFWEHNKGWDIHAKWNASRVEPGRQVIVNVDELADAVALRLAPADPFNRLLEEEKER